MIVTSDGAGHEVSLTVDWISRRALMAILAEAGTREPGVDFDAFRSNLAARWHLRLAEQDRGWPGQPDLGASAADCC